MSFFVHGPYGRVEVDYRVLDYMTPTLGGRRHPRPQHWQDVRGQALERDLCRCVVCNSKERVEVHHRTYARWGYERIEDVYTLCCLHHKKFHREGGLAA